MKNQPAPGPIATPTSGPTINSAAQTPAANPKTSAEARRTAILAAYDILRPAGEVDSRAQRVLVSALVLTALCVVPQKPATFSFGGMSFSLHHWLALAIPLCIVVLYTLAELTVAWKIQWERVRLILGSSIVSLRSQVHDDLEPLIAWGRAFLEEQKIMEEKRKEIHDWYQQRLEEINAENVALEKEERYPADSAAERLTKYETATQELKQRELQAGLPAFDAKRDQLLRTGFQQDDTLLRQNKQAIEEMQRLLELKKIRLAMGLVVPVMLAIFSLVTFAWAIHAS